jgi:hypothetical protein
VNGQRIATPTLLRAGDSIRVGQTTLRVEESGEPPTIPSAQPVAAQVPQAAPVAAQTGASVWLWVMLGVFFVALLGLSLFAVVWFATPKPTPSIAILPPTATLQGLSTLPTRTAAPTGVAVSVTGTPTVLPTVLATPASGGERTITPIPVIMPTITPIKMFPVPRLDKPSKGEKVTDSLQVTFNWTAVDVLRPDDRYRLQVSESQNDFEASSLVCTIYTRETFIAVVNKDPKCNDKWQFNPSFHYFWRVQVVAPTIEGKYGEQHSPTETAPISDFFWAP